MKKAKTGASKSSSAEWAARSERNENMMSSRPKNGPSSPARATRAQNSPSRLSAPLATPGSSDHSPTAIQSRQVLTAIGEMRPITRRVSTCIMPKLAAPPSAHRAPVPA